MYIFDIKLYVLSGPYAAVNLVHLRDAWWSIFAGLKLQLRDHLFREVFLAICIQEPSPTPVIFYEIQGDKAQERER